MLVQTVDGKTMKIRDNKKDEVVLNVLYDAGLRPGVNWQRELKELINDIAMRDGIEQSGIIQSPELLQIIGHSKLTGPQKLERIKDILMTQRYPQFAKAQSEFKRQIKDLKIGSNIKVKHAPYFEEEDISVEFTFRNQEELGQAIESLKKLQGVELVKNALAKSLR